MTEPLSEEEKEIRGLMALTGFSREQILALGGVARGEGPGESDHADCAFCQGRKAGQEGQSIESNPHPDPEIPALRDPRNPDYYDHDWGFWRSGFQVGAKEATGELSHPYTRPQD